MRRFARRTGTWGPWLVLPLMGWGVWWLAADVPWWQALAGLGILGVLGNEWSGSACPRLRLAPAGLVVGEPLRDRLVSWPDILSVASDARSLVLRVRDTEAPQEQRAILLPHEFAPLLAGDPTPAEAAAVIDRARLAPPVTGRGVAPVAAPVLVGAAWAAVAAAAFLLGH